MQNAILQSEGLVLPNGLSTFGLHSRKIVRVNQLLPVLIAGHAARGDSINHLLLGRPR
jgi:hypothetical protein